MPPKKKVKKSPPSKQVPLTSRGVTVKTMEEKYKGADLLMTCEIYGRSVPGDAQGKFFWYKVHSYDEKSETFSLEYQKKAIDAEG
jgi:hypothetical protein